MLRRIMCLVLVSFATISSYATEPFDSPINFKAIQKQFSVKGYYNKDKNEYRIGIPRDDLDVIVNGLKITPEMGLTSWLIFNKKDGKTSAVADVVLLQDQVNPVMSVALANNLQVIELHSPFLWDTPRVMQMHIRGEGKEQAIAKSIHTIIAEVERTANTHGEFPYTTYDNLPTTLNIRPLNQLFGEKSVYKNEAYKYIFKGDKQYEVSWAVFSGSDNNAIVEGSLTVLQSELQKTLQTLRKADFFVVAIYEHSLNDIDYYYVVHYSGVGKALRLAKIIRSVNEEAQQDWAKYTTPVLNQASPQLTQSDNCNIKKWAQDYLSASSEIDISKTMSLSSKNDLLKDQQLSSILNNKDMTTNNIAHNDTALSSKLFSSLGRANIDIAAYKYIADYQKLATFIYPTPDQRQNHLINTHNTSQFSTQLLMPKKVIMQAKKIVDTVSQQYALINQLKLRFVTSLNIIDHYTKNYVKTASVFYKKNIIQPLVNCFKKTEPQNIKVPNSFNKQVANALNLKYAEPILGVSQDLRYNLIASQMRNYNVIDKLIIANPITYTAQDVIGVCVPKKPSQLLTQKVASTFGMEYKGNLYGVPSGLLHDLLSFLNKDYDYVNKLIQSSLLTSKINSSIKQISDASMSVRVKNSFNRTTAHNKFSTLKHNEHSWLVIPKNVNVKKESQVIFQKQNINHVPFKHTLVAESDVSKIDEELLN